MIKFAGKVENGPAPLSINGKENCINSCYTDPICILVYVNSYGKCSLYSYLPGPLPLKVVETSPEAGCHVAFKTNLLDSFCPLTYKDINFTFTSKNGDIYSWNYSDDEGWSFSQCLDGWTRFDRKTVSVCMKAVLMKYGLTKEIANLNCEGLHGMLIGVETVKESKWMFEEMLKLTTKKKPASFWIDGVRNPVGSKRGGKCTPAGSKCDNFTWSDGVTNGNEAMVATNARLSGASDGKLEDCLTIKYEPGYTQTLNDVYCTGFQKATGAICGYKLY